MRQLFEQLKTIDRADLLARAAVLREYAEDAALTARACAGNAAGQADRLMGYTVQRAKGFSLFDFAILKVCLICFGAWMATLFSKAAQKCKPLLLVGFLASWMYLIWRIFVCQTDD